MATPIPVPDVTKSLLHSLGMFWPLLLGAALFSLGASGIMPRGSRHTRRPTKRQPAIAAAEPRSIRVPLSLAILAAGVAFMVWGLARLHSQ